MQKVICKDEWKPEPGCSALAGFGVQQISKVKMLGKKEKKYSEEQEGRIKDVIREACQYCFCSNCESSWSRRSQKKYKRQLISSTYSYL